MLDDLPQDPHRQEGDDEVIKDFIEKMEKFARELGLYLDSASGGRVPIPNSGQFDDIVRPLVTAKFIIGDEAFTDKVQNPELHTMDATLVQIEHATAMSEAEEIMRRYQESGKLFRSDDDE
jgi:hypothetical protein